MKYDFKTKIKMPMKREDQNESEKKIRQKQRNDTVNVNSALLSTFDDQSSIFDILTIPALR